MDELEPIPGDELSTPFAFLTPCEALFSINIHVWI
jgi:hypothetical protein